MNHTAVPTQPAQDHWDVFEHRFLDLVLTYLRIIERDGIDDPLGEVFTLSAVLSDLFAIAGLEPPIGLEARVGGEA